MTKRTTLAGVMALVLAAGSLGGCWGGDEECKNDSLGASFERPGPGGGRGGARSGSRGGKGSKGKSKPKPAGGVHHVDDDCDD